MPTETDVKLADDLAEFRLEAEKRFGTLDKSLEGVGKELNFVRWIGAFFAGVLVVLVGTSITVAWNASAVVSDVRYQGQRLEEFKGRLDAIGSDVKDQGRRLDRIEGRLDAMGKQLDILIGRTTPKAGG